VLNRDILWHFKIRILSGDNMKCKKCLHYAICEYSTIADKEITCKDFIYNTDHIKKTLKYYLDTNEEYGVVYIPKFVVEEIISNT